MTYVGAPVDVSPSASTTYVRRGPNVTP